VSRAFRGSAVGANLPLGFPPNFDEGLVGDFVHGFAEAVREDVGACARSARGAPVNAIFDATFGAIFDAIPDFIPALGEVGVDVRADGFFEDFVDILVGVFVDAFVDDLTNGFGANFDESRVVRSGRASSLYAMPSRGWAGFASGAEALACVPDSGCTSDAARASRASANSSIERFGAFGCSALPAPSCRDARRKRSSSFGVRSRHSPTARPFSLRGPKLVRRSFFTGCPSSSAQEKHHSMLLGAEGDDEETIHSGCVRTLPDSGHFQLSEMDRGASAM
jgi:hypothetical protein